ncbi:MAG: RdgB/HAM1 family non-canonical purine NTP pyrophosphatase [Rhodospirillaceae bacterium]|nr:RdgB/HAM1 family non-canonical purine NTP pyrophosphatase [Rhodospirillaceae bacterium]
MTSYRRFRGDTLVIASHNAGKVREIADLLGPYAGHFPSAGEFGLDDPEETGETFAANAALKARYVAERSGHPALADDSGLAVAALNGRPGVHSARWAEDASGRRDFGRAMERLEEALAGSADRRAWFVCSLCLAWPDGETALFEGRVDGTLVWPIRGANGFGYDPMFLPDGHDLTFGEMEPAAKHAISHRARAFAKLVAACFEAPV